MDTPALSDARPVFLLGFHRVGTTFLQRLLNCHRDLVIWGEHAGMISDLAEMHGRLPPGRLVKVDLAAFAEFSDYAEKFEPWASPVSAEEMLGLTARYLDAIYSSFGRIPRWGIKEIRYNSDEMLAFLARLFPRARFLSLTRDPQAIYLSRLHVCWTRELPGQDLAEHARKFYHRYTSATAAMQRFHAATGQDAMMLDFDDVAMRRVAWPELLAFLDLDPGRLRTDLVERVYAARVGSSYGDVGRPVDSGLADEALRTLQGLIENGGKGD